MKSFGFKSGIFIIIFGGVITSISQFLSPVFSFILGSMGIIVIVLGMFILFTNENKN